MWATLIGVIVGFMLGEGSRLLRDSWRVRQLRQAMRAECQSLIAQIPQLIDLTQKCVASLQGGNVLPGLHVPAATVVYQSVIAELAPHLTEKERNLLHVCYERLRVGDELLTNYATEVLDGLALRSKLPGFEPFGPYGVMLKEQVESYRIVQRLLHSFLDGNPEDVFYVAEPAADRERAQYE